MDFPSIWAILLLSTGLTLTSKRTNIRYGVDLNFWIFMRQLNRLLEVNDINMSRIEQEVPINRVHKPSANQSRIDTLIQRLETGRPERLMQSFSHVVTVSALHVEIFLSSRRSHATSAGGRFGVSRGFT